MHELRKAIVREHSMKLVEKIRKAMTEEPKSPADIESMLAFIEQSTATYTDPEMLAAIMLEVRKAVQPFHEGPTVH